MKLCNRYQWFKHETNVSDFNGLLMKLL